MTSSGSLHGARGCGAKMSRCPEIDFQCQARLHGFVMLNRCLSYLQTLVDFGQNMVYCTKNTVSSNYGRFSIKSMSSCTKTWYLRT